LLVLALTVAFLSAWPVATWAASPSPSSSGSSSPTPPNGQLAKSKCGKEEVQLSVPLLDGKECVSNDKNNGGAIVAYIKMLLQFLSAGVGVTVVLMLVIAGVQYIISTGDPASIKAAKERIVNAITALALFVMGYAILSFIIPGGIF
jgi:hypothetical protein